MERDVKTEEEKDVVMLGECLMDGMNKERAQADPSIKVGGDCRYRLLSLSINARTPGSDSLGRGQLLVGQG